MSESFLLDSHVWLWLVSGEARIGSSALQLIRAAGRRQGLAVSEISFWELALKAEKGQLEMRPDPDEWLRRAAAQPGLGVIQVDREILVRSTQLAWTRRDPADRILVASALFYDLVLATADAPILHYAEKDRRLRVLDVRA